LTDAQLVDRWDDLKDPDAGKAYQAILALGRGGDRVARGIGPRLQPTAALEPVLLRRYIEDLDDPQFSVREKAAAALLRVADQAEDDLRRVLERTRSPEVRQRIRGILDVSQDLQPSPDRLREVRAVEVLERVGTTAAREQLIRLAGGAERANLTREAKAALRRLDREAPDVR
jgi:hypothetical protein